MKENEFVSLVLALSRRRETNGELWGHLAKVLVTLMNTQKLKARDLMIVTRALVNAKVRSDKLFGFIVRYFMSTTGGVIDDRLPSVTAVFFFYSLAKAMPALNDNEEFFTAVNNYLQSKMGELTEQECTVSLDAWKLNQAFISEETKVLLAERKLILSHQEK